MQFTMVGREDCLYVSISDITAVRTTGRGAMTLLLSNGQEVGPVSTANLPDVITEIDLRNARKRQKS